MSLAGSAYYFRSVAPYESTDDAAIESHVMPVASQVSGRVIRLLVGDNQEVKKGELLLEIDSRDYNLKLLQANARLTAAYSRLEKANAQLTADQTHGETRAALSRADLRIAFAGVEQSEAEARQAELDLSDTRIMAFSEGRVTRRTVENGAYVQAGQTLMAIVPPEVWVVANFKETQIGRIRVGAPVAIRVDAYPRQTFTGRVDSIQAGTSGRFNLAPKSNPAGDFIKMAQRIPVKILFDSPGPAAATLTLGPGMSVEPQVRVK